MAKGDKVVQAQATVPLPSADLIIYRFNQIDEKFADLNKNTNDRFEGLSKKLDGLTGNFATKEELAAIDHRLTQVEGNISKVVWLVMSAVIGAVLVTVGLKVYG